MNAGTQRPGRRSGQSWRTFPARWCYFEYPTGHRHLVQNPAPDGRSAENTFTLRAPPRGGGVRRYSKSEAAKSGMLFNNKPDNSTSFTLKFPRHCRAECTPVVFV